MPTLSALYRYPLKSGASESLALAQVDALGLVGDRRWMVVDAASGKFLTQRTLAPLGRIRVEWIQAGILLSVAGGKPLPVAIPGADQDLRGVTVWSDSLRAPDAGDEAADWLSAQLGKPVRLVHMPLSRARQVDTAFAKVGEQVHFGDGFPLLLISEASLADLSSRVGRPLEMLRFRPNLVISDCAAFAEDRWRRIRIGAIELRIAKPCTRCAVTTLDPHTFERAADAEPLRTLATYRKSPDGVMFGQNLIPNGSGELRTGMPVEILE